MDFEIWDETKKFHNLNITIKPEIINNISTGNIILATNFESYEKFKQHTVQQIVNESINSGRIVYCVISFPLQDTFIIGVQSCYDLDTVTVLYCYNLAFEYVYSNPKKYPTIFEKTELIYGQENEIKIYPEFVICRFDCEHAN